MFLSETAALADVVLPTAQWAEEEGTLTNLEGRVLHRKRALPPPEGVRTDLQVLLALATRLGREKYFSDDPREVFDELRRASAGGAADYSGITYERIDAEQGVFWPCPSIDHPGTPRLFADRFPTADGRAHLRRTVQTAPAELPDAGYPYYLTTGRTMSQYQSGAQTRRVRSLTLHEPDAYVQLHPDLAAQHGIRSADVVELRTRRGTALFRARLSDDIRPDTVFTPFHWGGRSTANRLTNAALDPTSRMPEFKVCAVALARAPDQDVDLALPPPA
jgi:assimilatory nitrate reductase catalytic subunit